jgi:hypothetical protein
MVMRIIRCALAMRDAEGEALVAQEMLDQVRLPLKAAAAELLDRAGLLKPRAAPPPALWPTRSCADCDSWGIARRWQRQHLVTTASDLPAAEATVRMVGVRAANAMACPCTRRDCAVGAWPTSASSPLLGQRPHGALPRPGPTAYPAGVLTLQAPPHREQHLLSQHDGGADPRIVDQPPRGARSR